jgi:hypothetical protein
MVLAKCVKYVLEMDGCIILKEVKMDRLKIAQNVMAKGLMCFDFKLYKTLKKNDMDKSYFISQMKDYMLLGNKSVTISKEDFENLIKYAEEKPDNIKIRQISVGQSGYGMDGCRICGSKWMRSPNCEKKDHKKDCIAYPNN